VDVSVRDKILASAEARARVGGYHGFSFRDVAEDVGIKSASVHYHFPTKSDLAAALAARYTVRARDFLGDAVSIGRDAAIARMVDLFRNALLRDDKMCLCGLFGAECDSLPTEVVAATEEFFSMALDYLSSVGAPAARILARLEGALILARTLKRPALFEDAVHMPDA
jgi:TetR/AcrR family transcriptional regulator, transcriptional repressor for nem operon